MTGLKVHGYVYSTASMRVFAALHELDLDYELVLVDLVTSAQKQEPFISLNPFGQVPAFEDGDLTLFESRAITQYIAHTYASSGAPLIVADPNKMAIMMVWAEVEAHQFDPVASKLAWEIFIKPLRGMVTDEALAEELEAKLAKVLDVYEARLSESKYLGGDEFTLVDLHHLPVMHYLVGTRVKKLFDERPHVSAWSTGIMARPAWAKVVAMQSH